jgi:uroporphyrinogen III methyltransferase / synthase
MSLTNRRIVVTRAPHQALKLVELLQAKGAVPLIYPCIDIAPPENLSPLDAALRNLHNYEWLIITSSNTVIALKRRFQALQIQPDFAHLKIAAVGDSTQDAIESFLGASVQFVPENQSAVGLADMLNVRDGMRVLLPQSRIASLELAETLKEKGADITLVEAYQTIMGQGGEDVPTMIAEKRIDVVTFTSSSTVENFIERIKPQTATHIPAACIGQSTADTAWDLGFHTILVPRDYTLEKMVQKIEEYFA